jgi:hypothetical protein
MAIIVGDIHGNVEKVQAFLSYKPEVEHLALGDYLDSFYEPPKRQLQALRLLMESNAVLLWGNHDVHYLDHAPFLGTGCQYGREYMYNVILEKNLGRFKAAHAADGWLCSHAGVVKKFLPRKKLSVVEVAELLNKKMEKFLDDRKWFNWLSIGSSRGGHNPVGGFLWFDHVRETGLADLPQLFGHTAGREPVVKESYVCLDTTNVQQKCWVWDTEENRLVELETEIYFLQFSDLPEDEIEPLKKFLEGRSAPIGGYWIQDYREFLGSVGRLKRKGL